MVNFEAMVTPRHTIFSRYLLMTMTAKSLNKAFLANLNEK